MKNADELFTERFGGEVVRHRLSWFATLQGLLFLWFILIDYKTFAVLPQILVCVAVAMCLPGIANAYKSPALRYRLHVALAIGWVALGMARSFLDHS